MENTATEVKDKKVVDIFPLGKGKRILVYLADLFLTFIAAFSLFNMVVFPSAKAIVNYDVKTNDISYYSNKRDSVLYGNKILFSKDENQTTTYFQRNLSYTFEMLASYYVMGASSDYDVVYTYFVGIRNDNESYINVMKSNDTEVGFFDYSSSRPVLKEAYKVEFAPAFDEKDTMGDTAKSHYETFQNEFFLQCYYDIVGDIEKNDLSFDGFSYEESQGRVRELSDYLDKTIAISVYLSELLAIIALFLLVPLFNHNRKTLGMLFMRLERVNCASLQLCRKRDVLLYFVYQLALNVALIMFVPIPTVTINAVFGLGVLLPLSLISAGFAVISLFFVLFNSFNRSLSDLLTGTIMITDTSLDEIYRSKGYKV